MQKQVARLIKAFSYSKQGIKHTFANEIAFRQESYLAIILIPLGIWLGESGAEKALLTSSVLLIPMTELINSSIERTIDRISTTPHPLSGQAKDIASAAVLIALINMLIIWTCIIFT